MLKINDIFWSAQGEGLRSGVSSIFIRLTGCSLRCPYCDSRASWTQGQRMPLAEINEKVAVLKAIYPQARLVITGGEPLEQDLQAMVDVFRNQRYFVALETNGLHFQDLAIDWWTVSPKDVSAYRVHRWLWPRIAEIKLLVTAALHIQVLKKIRERSQAPIIIQPESYDRRKYARTFLFFQSCQQSGIENVRLGLQMQQIYRCK
jgi:organic radical activating enzyme